MHVDPLGEEEIDPPPPAVIRRYLSLGPPRRFSIETLEEEFGRSNVARQFATKATKRLLSVRVERGGYVAVDPSVAVRSWALPDYYARLLVLHDALDHLEIDHAFACLPASAGTDLVFERPWVVTPEETSEEIPKIERFIYDYGATRTSSLDVLGEAFELPVLSGEETALVLAATGLPREAQAASLLLEDDPPSEDLIPSFNYVGLDLGWENLAVEDPRIGFPRFVERRREALSEDLLREGRS